MLSKLAPFAVALAISLAGAGVASAAPLAIGGTGPLGSYSGSLTYTAVNDTSATLSVSLTNTSPAANDGFLTAFVLNNPGALTGVSLTTAPNAFWGVLGLDDNDVNASPYGKFDFGASTGDGFQGGGAPKRGIADGDTGTFIFSLSGSGLLALDEASFIKAISSGTGIGEGSANFVARFRGFGDGGSDKVPNTASAPPPVVGVPEPMSLALFGAGLAGLGLIPRRRNTA